jgi:Protein of unknown function (DUF2975)
MEIKTKRFLTILNVLSWVIFTGLCIQAGAFLVNIFYSLAVNPVAAKYFQKGIDLSSLYLVGARYFFAETLLMVLVAVMKAYMFYQIILIFKVLNMVQPFSKEVGRLIFNISYVALVIGLLSWMGFEYSDWLVRQHVKLPNMYRYFGGADVFVLMAVALFVIAQVFKRGIEIQSENDLTV